MAWWQKTALVLAAIGALNIGLAELNFDVLALVLGGIPTLALIVNYLIGICGIYALVKAFK